MLKKALNCALLLGPGEYASLERLSNRISSVREVR